MSLNISTPISGLTIIVVLFCSCSIEIDTSLDAKSFPIVYSVFNKYDTLNTVYVTRSFSGDGGALNDSKINDSIYFDNIRVEVLLKKKFFGGSDTVQLLRTQSSHKESGFFHNPDVEYFSLNKDISEFDWYQTKVIISGNNEYVGSTLMIEPPELLSPKHDHSTISIYKDNPLTLSWYTKNHTWYDIRVDFFIITNSGIETQMDTITYIKSGIIPDASVDFYRESITTDKLLSLLNSKYSSNNVSTRKIESIESTVFCGDESFLEYMEEYNWRMNHVFFMDFDTTSFMGIASSKANSTLTNLQLDIKSKRFLAEDPQFQKFKFVVW